MALLTQAACRAKVGVTNAQLPMPGKRMNCGVAGEERCPPLTKIEARSHFGAWCIVSSPLVLGMDLTDAKTLDLHWDTITNIDAIEVNQDYAGFSGSRFAKSEELTTFTACEWGPVQNRSDGSCAYATTMSWYKPLSGRDSRGSTMAVLLMNNGAKPATLGFAFDAVPGLTAGEGCAVYDIWSRRSLGFVPGPKFKIDAVQSRDSVFLTLSGCR